MRFIVTLSLLPICFILAAASQKTGIVNRHIRSTNEFTEHAQATRVVSMDFCYSCLQEDAKGYQTSYKKVPVYAALSNDHKATFGPSFTICSSASNPGGQLQLFFTLLGQDGNLAIQASLMNDVTSATLFLLFGNNVAHSPNRSVPLFFPHQWVRSCVAMSTQSGHVEWVIDGVVVVNTKLEVLKEAANIIPKNLTGNLLLGAGKFVSGWLSIGNTVTGLNIFSSALSAETMVRLTQKRIKYCNDKGSYLDWANMHWTLHGKAKIMTAPVLEPCEEDSLVRIYFTKFTRMADCMHHCQKFGGRAPSIVNMTEMQHFQVFMNNNLNGQFADGFWLAITDEEEEGVWKDYYTGEAIQYDGPFTGGKPNGGARENCAIQISNRLWIDWLCEEKEDDTFCVCSNKEKHILKLRGLCKYSKIDSLYIPWNTRQDIRKLEYIGQSGTTIHFKENQQKWAIEASNQSKLKTQGSSASPLASFALGKHHWVIENDSIECGKGKSYNVYLKLTGCEEDEFTCNNGQCIKMTKRCDNLPNCRDRSDETKCTLWELEGIGYNKEIPPIGMNLESVDLVEVQISIHLMKVINIDEEKNKIDLQFEICLEWYENRVTYNNLKSETAMNVLNSWKQKRIWLPLVIFYNTDQKETTRLGMQNEWSTEVNVVRKGNFTRSGLDSVDEVEMFKGDENPLIMKQVYTHRFQCKYDLDRYPFDTQHCSIDMVLGSYDIKMVTIVPSNFSMNEDTELTLFTIISWNLEYKSPLEPKDGLRFRLVLKRKIMNSLLTTYLPSGLLILITFATTYFKPFFFEAALSANLTIMLVMTTIFIGEMQMLPTTAYIKMVDIWLVFCQLVPFAEVILLTVMEYHRDDAKYEEAVVDGKGNTDEKTKTIKVNEIFSDPTAHLAFEDAGVKSSLEVDNRLYWFNMLGEYKCIVKKELN